MTFFVPNKLILHKLIIFLGTIRGCTLLVISVLCVEPEIFLSRFTGSDLPGSYLSEMLPSTHHTQHFSNFILTGEGRWSCLEFIPLVVPENIHTHPMVGHWKF